ncbi:hypothetical protein M513_08711, partial [Trichuris suis]
LSESWPCNSVTWKLRFLRAVNFSTVEKHDRRKGKIAETYAHRPTEACPMETWEYKNEVALERKPLKFGWGNIMHPDLNQRRTSIGDSHKSGIGGTRLDQCESIRASTRTHRLLRA